MNSNTNQNELTSMHLPRTQNYIMTTDTEGRICKWDLSGNPEVMYETWGKIHAAAMSEDARFIYVSLEKDFIISKFNLDDRKMELDFNKAHKDNIFSLKLFHNGIKLISGSADMRIIIWSVSNGQI